jgi:hypothetical protein
VLGWPRVIVAKGDFDAQSALLRRRFDPANAIKAHKQIAAETLRRRRNVGFMIEKNCTLLAGALVSRNQLSCDI